MYTGHMDRPLARKTRTTRPTVGSARPKEARLIARNAPLPVWPISRPSGRPIAAATSVASNEYWRCSARRCAMPSEPDHWAPLTSHLPRFLKSSYISGSPPLPRGEDVLEGDQQRVRHHRKEQGQDYADDHRRRVVALEAVREELAQAAVADVGRDGHQGDRHDGGDPDARHDHGQREGELHGEE